MIATKARDIVFVPKPSRNTIDVSDGSVVLRIVICSANMPVSIYYVECCRKSTSCGSRPFPHWPMEPLVTQYIHIYIYIECVNNTY
jgi:hypothetical protein